MKFNENYIIYPISIGFGIFVFFSLPENYLLRMKLDNLFSYLLTTNSIFIAILISYFLSRITWVKDVKKNVSIEAVEISRKITDYRRILNILTKGYQVWNNQDKSTKSLLEHGRFKNVDYYDYKTYFSQKKIHQDLLDNINFRDGISMVYLAMISLVKDRNYEGYYYDETLFKDFQIDGIYNFEVLNKWIECSISGSISASLNGTDWINYNALREYKVDVMFFADRINRKYSNYEFDDKLIKEISEDMQEHYFPELVNKLEFLKEGIVGLNLFLLALISFTSILGVLFPLLLLLIDNKINLYYQISAIVISINVVLISIFILKFPFLVKKEIQYNNI